MHLLIATHNTHKTEEIAAMLGNLATVTDLTSHPDIPPADETGTTFEENATIKALEASKATSPNTLVLSDDSGLEVDPLSGAPGVHSARYASENATDAENRAKLLQELSATSTKGKDRTARFRCCMVLAQAGKKIAAFDGAVEGLIGTTEKGQSGFGYDPLFIPKGHCETFAELSSSTKNSMSHRARALEKIVAHLKQLTSKNS